MTDWPGQERLAALSEFSTDAVMLVSAEGLIQWASASTRDVLGYEPAALAGTRARDLVLAEDLDTWNAMVAELMERPDAPCSGSYRCRHRDGSARWTFGTARNLLTEPRIGAVLVRLRDVTPAHETEARLQASEDRYRQLFEEATDVVFETDEEGFFRFVNPATLRTFGYDEHEVLGRRFTEFIREDHRRRVFEHYRAQADARHAASYIEFPAVAKDGTEVWVGQNAWIVTDAQGKFLGMRAVARDITQRRLAHDALQEAEARYRSLVEQSMFAVYILQGERLVYVNPKGVELLGYTVEEVLAMPSVLDLIFADDRAFVSEQLARLGQGAASVHYVARAVKKDGTSVQGEVSCSISDYGGQPAIFATVMDISDRLRLEEQLRQAQKMEAIGRLAGGIAHDFNNLLTAIRGNAELLSYRTKKEADDATEVEEILLASDRAASLTRQLLAFSRRQDVINIDLDVNELVENVARMARRLIGPDIRLEVQTGAALRPVLADPGQVEQILLNLIVNARDALPEGGRICVKTENRTLAEGSPESVATGLTPGSYILLHVIDDGIGMDRATQTRIFEPFFTTKEPGRGTGLGLSTVYGIIRHMGGAVTVESERNRGATFTVYLRAAAPEDVTGPAGRRARQEA